MPARSQRLMIIGLGVLVPMACLDYLDDVIAHGGCLMNIKII